MTHHEHHRLGTALHDRVRDEHPDLARLVDRATRTGTRIRRRRQAGVSLGAVAAVAAVAVLGGQLAGGPGGTTGSGSGFATQPSAAAPTASATTDDTAATLDADEALRAVRLRGLRSLQEVADARARMLDSPVRLALETWVCTDYLDEKLTCDRGPAQVTVTVRDASSHDDYRDPDKSDVGRIRTFVSEVHGPHFATVMPGPGADQADVDAVGAALVWD